MRIAWNLRRTQPTFRWLIFDQRILIIGAGMAGLTTAYTIEQSPVSVSYVVLEAKDRIGGRIQSFKGIENLVVEDRSQ